MSGNSHTIKAAQRMIARYGDDALRQVDGRIEELAQLGNDDGDARRLWRQVREIVVAMLEDPSGSPSQ